jgi:hypothetical protein
MRLVKLVKPRLLSLTACSVPPQARPLLCNTRGEDLAPHYCFLSNTCRPYIFVFQI